MSLKQQIAVQPLGPGLFRSVNNPTRMGALSEFVFGGNTIAIAVNAAHQTLDSKYHLYSICGYFIRPAITDRKLLCHVESIRDSKSFKTRQIRVSQSTDDGSVKLCLIAFADFHIEEPRSVVTYSTPPGIISSSDVLSHTNSTTTTSIKKNSGLYRNIGCFFDLKPIPDNNPSREGAEQNLGADSIPSAPSMVTKEMFRMSEPLDNEAEQVSALAFYTDKGLAYLPAVHGRQDLWQASACATLEFSLRIFAHGLNLRNWHFSEQKTLVAGNARAFSEGRVWDENGSLVASMTQQTIFRPGPELASRL
ncbi:hypothetical protein N8T08_010489 [Aspergillus melleus]|uniref:Uncharacterized protein n=1 Tax=Aspergillus melleus TaxID=138277 RepID=A0ACC3ARA2_9EURO|nr:hypothetical protein N8T08_010489 [Aspergillus melleus]